MPVKSKKPTAVKLPVEFKRLEDDKKKAAP